MSSFTLALHLLATALNTFITGTLFHSITVLFGAIYRDPLLRLLVAAVYRITKLPIVNNESQSALPHDRQPIKKHNIMSTNPPTLSSLLHNPTMMIYRRTMTLYLFRTLIIIVIIISYFVERVFAR